MHFMNNNKDIFDDDSIMMMFNSIIKYGDINMAQDMFSLIRNKTYPLFLILRDKIRADKNFDKTKNSDINKNIIDDFHRK